MSEAKSASQFEIVDAWPKMVGIVTGSTLVFAVLYNWAYFRATDISAMQFFTISDHITSALEWLPGAAIWYGASLLISNHLGSTNVSPTVGQPRKHRPVLQRLGIAALVVLIAFMYLTSRPGEFTALVFAGFLMLTFVTASMYRRDELSKQWRLALTYGPLYCLVAIWLGNMQAFADFSKSEGDTTIAVKESAAVENVLVLRRLDRGILVRQVSENHVLFIPWDRVLQLTNKRGAVENRDRACVWFHILCEWGPRNSG